MRGSIYVSSVTTQQFLHCHHSSAQLHHQYSTVSLHVINSPHPHSYLLHCLPTPLIPSSNFPLNTRKLFPEMSLCGVNLPSGCCLPILALLLPELLLEGKSGEVVFDCRKVLLDAVDLAVKGGL